MTAEPDHRAALVRTAGDVWPAVRRFLPADGHDGEDLFVVIVREALLGPLARRLIEQGRQVVVAPAEAVFPGTSATMFRFYDECIQGALAACYRHVRIIGDPVWFARGDAGDWCSVERLANLCYQGWPVSALCLLDGRVPRPQRAAFLAAHPRTVAGTPNPRYEAN